jgi:hypothetical protein
MKHCSVVFSIFLITRTLYPQGPSVPRHLIPHRYSNFTPAFVHADAIERLPLVHSPEAFGLHPNSEISYCNQGVADIWSDLLELQPQRGELIYAKEIPICWCSISQTFSNKWLISVKLSVCVFVHMCVCVLNIFKKRASWSWLILPAVTDGEGFLLLALIQLFLKTRFYEAVEFLSFFCFFSLFVSKFLY